MDVGHLDIILDNLVMVHSIAQIGPIFFLDN